MCQCEQWNRSQALAEPVSSSDMQSGAAIASGASLRAQRSVPSVSVCVIQSNSAASASRACIRKCGATRAIIEPRDRGQLRCWTLAARFALNVSFAQGLSRLFFAFV
jgi:hypothetical protein